MYLKVSQINMKGTCIQKMTIECILHVVHIFIYTHINSYYINLHYIILRNIVYDKINLVWNQAKQCQVFEHLPRRKWNRLFQLYSLGLGSFRQETQMTFQKSHAAELNRHALVERSRDSLFFHWCIVFWQLKIFDIIRDLDNQEVLTIPT